MPTEASGSGIGACASHARSLRTCSQSKGPIVVTFRNLPRARHSRLVAAARGGVLALRAGIELLIGLHASRGPASPLGPLPAGPRGLAGLGRGGVPRATSRARQLLTGGLLLVLALLTACVNGQDRPIAVSLDELARQEASYDGKLVRTQGVVRSFERPRHYWIEDAGLQRVGLVPGDVVAPLVDREVHVVGRFRFDERTGRVIEVERIEPLSVPVEG